MTIAGTLAHSKVKPTTTVTSPKSPTAILSRCIQHSGIPRAYLHGIQCLLIRLCRSGYSLIATFKLGNVAIVILIAHGGDESWDAWFGHVVGPVWSFGLIDFGSWIALMNGSACQGPKTLILDPGNGDCTQ